MLNILYVEDEPDIRTIATITLESVGGFHVMACASGDEGLRRARDSSPDIVLLDIMMPGMDGPETMRRMRQIPHMEHKPYIFMTAKIQPAEVASYMDLGAAGVIAKPFDPMQVCGQISHLYQAHSRPAK
jgi:two-component system OmpR family response regulator